MFETGTIVMIWRNSSHVLLLNKYLLLATVPSYLSEQLQTTDTPTPNSLTRLDRTRLKIEIHFTASSIKNRKTQQKKM